MGISSNVPKSYAFASEFAATNAPPTIFFSSIDLNEKPLDISGQKLQRSLDLQQDHILELAKSLAKVDGALHIRADLNLHGFACLLDGRAAPGESRARGARFNSAIRFSSEHQNLIVVVVSADWPVSVIQEGLDLTAQSERPALSGHMAQPPTLKEWLKR